MADAEGDRHRPARHPALRAILARLARGEALANDDIEVLRRQLGELERSRHGGESAVVHDVVQPHDDHCPEPPPPLIEGYASRDGTERLAARRPGSNHPSFYRSAEGLRLGSIGIGTFRGAKDATTDRGYEEAITSALAAGVNVVDTSLNYRGQRSERVIGRALRIHCDLAGARRDEILVCTKGGYLVAGAIPDAARNADDVVEGQHLISPLFLRDQIVRSRNNLGLATLDVYFLHNPEIQLAAVGRHVFDARIAAAFAELETAAALGTIRTYGIASWSGFRGGGLDLAALVAIARTVAGATHRFRFVQTPFNLGMQDVASPRPGSTAALVDVAADCGVHVLASAPLMQGRLARDLPPDLAALIPGFDADGQRALQFARSTPGIMTALPGMRTAERVRELIVAGAVPPLSSDALRRLTASGF